MDREQQIKLVDTADERASRRADAWAQHPHVREASRNDVAAVKRMKPQTAAK